MLFDERICLGCAVRNEESNDAAPSILGYERFPDGWFAVAMEYVEHDISITKPDLLTFH